MNSMDRDILSVHYSDIERNPSRDNQQYTVGILNVSKKEPKSKANGGVMKSDDISITQKTLCGLKQPSLAGLCVFAVYTILVMTTGVLIVCFTSPRKTNETCQINFNGKIQHSIDYDTHPRQVAVGHFNNDTHLDIIFANSGTDNIGILLGYGNGSFASQMTYSTGFRSIPYSVAVGDFNKDDRLDVVVANFGTNNIGLLLGHGNGSFKNQIIFSLDSSRPLSLAVADMNNDTQLDIIVVNYGTSSVSILLGLNDGSFRIETIYHMGYDSIPYSITIADFNNDGLLDIATVNYGTSNLVILFSNGNNSFISHEYLTGSGSRPCSITAGDFNNDNILDIAVANSGTGNIGVFLGYQNGTFANMRTQLIDSHSSPDFIVVSDFDKDNRLDIAVLDLNSNNVYVLKGYENGSFYVTTRHSTGSESSPSSIAVGDFDNDNRSDIAITNNNTNNILVLTAYNIYPNTTQKPYPTGSQSEPFSVAVGDFNNDHHLDIVVANSISNNIGLFIGLGNGAFRTQKILYTRENSFPYFVAINDFNNDKQLDIVFVMRAISEISILFGFGNGSFTYGNTYSTGDQSLPRSLAFGDFNNDNHLDIVVANTGATYISIFYGYGNGNFTNMIPFVIKSDFYPLYIAVGDFNSDNKSDIIVSNYDTSDIDILLGFGNGSFSILVINLTNNGYLTGLSVGDLNKDNYLDIVYTSPRARHVGVLLGHGNGSFENVTRYYTDEGSWPWSVILVDLNDDTHLDIAITNAFDYSIGIFFGFGNGSFQGQKTFSTGYNSFPIRIAFGDFNEDNQPDLVVANRYTDNIGVFILHYEGDFTYETNYFTGSGPHPYSIAVGDFDNDSESDIVAANSGNDNIQIFLDYKKGMFLSNNTYSTGFGSDPQFVIVTDFNKDKQLDIAVTNYRNDSINVFAGFGNGTFDTASVYSIDSGSFPCSIAAGDLNNDSWMDIVIANQGKDNVGVFLGFDYPTFTNETIYQRSLFLTPYDIGVGDFNHDLHWDIVVPNYDSNNVGVYLGNGNGTFAEEILSPTGFVSKPLSIAVGYFNNDKHLDMVIANNGSNSISVCMGYGNGSFKSPVTYSTGNSSYPISIAVGDLNKDNRSDIIVANYDGDYISIFLGYSNGTFADQILYPMLDGSSPTSVIVGDLNNDNLLDIVVANKGLNNIGILFGYGNGTFGSITTYPTGDNSGPYSIAIGDLNRDNWMDIAVANAGGMNVGVFFGSGNGTFLSQKTYPTGAQSDLYAIIIDDLNNDAILDITVCDLGNGNGNIGVFYGYGDGNFTVLKTYSTGFDSDPSSIAIRDFNNDGQVDLAISYSNKNSIGIMLRYKSEPFATLATFSTGNGSRPSSVALGDFNNDHQLDIAVANFGTNNIAILLGYGNGTFTQQHNYSTGDNSSPVSVAVGYINNDTQLDIVVANSNANNIVIFLGSSDGIFAVLTTYPTGQSSAPSSIAINDLNKDNHLDIVVTTYGTNKLLVFLGLGNGTFLQPKSFSLDYNARPQSVTIGDFNSDSLLDIAVANYGTDYVEILLQTC